MGWVIMAEAMNMFLLFVLKPSVTFCPSLSSVPATTGSVTPSRLPIFVPILLSRSFWLLLSMDISLLDRM